MTRPEFAAAAAEGRRVRLLDRSRAFYVDDWYEPTVNDDGHSTFAPTPARTSTSATTCSRS